MQLRARKDSGDRLLLYHPDEQIPESNYLEFMGNTHVKVTAKLDIHITHKFTLAALTLLKLRRSTHLRIILIGFLSCSRQVRALFQW